MDPPFDPSQYESEDSSDFLESTSEDRIWAMLAHLAIFVLTVIGPLIIWLIKKEESPFVEDQAREALNFQLSVMILSFASIILVITIPLFPIIAIGSIVFAILGAIQVNQGVAYRYPINIRMIK